MAEKKQDPNNRADWPETSDADYARGARIGKGPGAGAAAPKPPDTSEDEKYGKMSQAEIDALPPLIRGGAITRRRRWQSAQDQAAALKEKK